MSLILNFTCDKCGLALQEKISFVHVFTNSDTYIRDFQKEHEISTLENGDLCKECSEKYKEEQIRAKALYEAEINARFWRDEKDANN